jgi:hypothetical protein
LERILGGGAGGDAQRHIVKYSGWGCAGGAMTYSKILHQLPQGGGAGCAGGAMTYSKILRQLGLAEVEV